MKAEEKARKAEEERWKNHPRTKLAAFLRRLADKIELPDVGSA